MLTLFTGAPGSGKTAALVGLLNERYCSDDAGKRRPIYVHRSKHPTDGVTPFADELKLPHEKIEGDEWHQVVPDGAVVVVDEVQDLWRARGPSVKPSDAVMALETHRHRGIDVYLTTQQPSLLDKNVRALVGRHVHIREMGVLGRWWYEWPEVSQSIAWKTAPIKKRYKLPKEAFALYKSASLHIKPIRSFPKIILVFLGSMLLLGGGAYYVYGRIMAKQGPNSPLAAGIKPTAGVAPGTGSASSPKGAAVVPITGPGILAAAVPRVYDRPETAPMYDELRKVVHMPRVQGGYCQGSSCTCYLQAGIKAPMTVEACRAWLANPPFDPYYKPPELAQGSGQAQPASTTPAAAVQPGQPG